MIEYKFETYTIVATTVLLAGIIRLYLFYKSFNISILPFIELEELTVLAFDNFLFFIIFLISNIFIASFFYKKQKSEKNRRVDRLKEYGFFKIDKILLLIILVAFLYLIQYQLEKVLFYEFILWVVLLIVGIYINPLIYIESQKILKKKAILINRPTIILILSAVNLFCFAGVSGISEAYKIKTMNYYSGSEFKLSNETSIVSDSQKYYVGKTKGFLFFYQPEEKVTHVIPSSFIEKIEIKK